MDWDEYGQSEKQVFAFFQIKLRFLFFFLLLTLFPFFPFFFFLKPQKKCSGINFRLILTSPFSPSPPLSSGEEEIDR